MILVYAVTVAVMLSSGLLLTWSSYAFAHFPLERKLHDQRNPAVMQGAAFRRKAVINSILSTGMIFGFIALMGERLIDLGTAPAWRVAFEALRTLLVYDFLYYFLHRDVFHKVKYFVRVHSVHHTGKYPTATDSLWIHPVETITGVATLLFSLWITGPLHVWSFGLFLLAYTHLNITVHWGLRLRTFPLNLISFMSAKHDVHHKSMRSGNYSSITPLPDWLFGTMRTPEAGPG